MKVSKTFKNTGKTYLKKFEGRSSTWTSDEKRAHKFKTKKEAEKLAELHGGNIEK